MITVHHLNNSRSQRVLWLLEELRLAYEVKRYQRDAKTMLAPPELLAVHPLGKSPIIVDGTATFAESGAIIDFLVERYGGGRLIPPAGTPERLSYTYWLHYAEGSAMPPLLLKLVFDRVANGPAPWPISAVARHIAGRVQNSFIGPQLKRHLDYMEAALGAQEAAKSRAGLDASRPRLTAFLDRIHARDAYQRALERGGPYSY